MLGTSLLSAATETLAVTGLGMVSCLGHGVVASCAASRAGISRISALDDSPPLWDEEQREVVPVCGHTVPCFTRGFSGLGRLVSLGAAALKDFCQNTEPIEWARTALFITTSEDFYCWRRHARRGERLEHAPHRAYYSQYLIPRLLKAAGVTEVPQVQRLFFGEIGFLQALHEAARLLSTRHLERCIVGGVDSLTEPIVIDSLATLRLLKSPTNPVGFLPGEAAAFIQVERPSHARRRSVRVQSLLSGWGWAHEPFDRTARAVAVGEALSQVIENTLNNSWQENALPQWVLSGLNGDHYRASDWGNAQVRLRERMHRDALIEWIPALSFGETAAATGPLMVCMVARASERRYAPTRCALAWLGSDSGARGSFSLQGPILPSATKSVYL